MGPAVASPKERTILPKSQVLARRTMHRTPAACCGIAGGQEPCDVLALAVLAIRRIGIRSQDEIERHLELHLVQSLDGNTAASATPQDQIMAWSVRFCRISARRRVDQVNYGVWTLDESTCSTSKGCAFRST